MVTQNDIARQLNLSKATVSRILSNQATHDDDTRAKVLALASRLGYRHLRPTVRAQVSKKNALRVIGVLIETPDGPLTEVPVVSIRMLRGISEAARTEGVAVHIEYVPASAAAQANLPEYQPPLLKANHLSGLILVGRFSVPAIRELARQVPCVRLNINDSDLNLDCVGQNDIDAVEKAVAYLWALGHRQIGLLSEPPNLWPIQARLAGYIVALARRNRPWSSECIIQSSQPFAESGWEPEYEHVLKQIRRGVRAWICNHDDMGYGLAHYLKHRGLRVPADASICGFDNLAQQEGLPKMTTIDWPFEDIGAVATRRLLRRQRELTAAPLHIMLTGRLITGESTGPLRS